MSLEHYGQLDSEKKAELNAVSRKIVKEITDFGVTQPQLLMIIYLLSLQLENHEHMCAISSVVREIEDGTFLAPVAE
jgi:hypothetical protein